VTIASLARPGERILCVNDVYGGTYRYILRTIGRKGDLTSKVRESLVSIGRLVLFLANEADGMKWPKEMRSQLKSMQRDVQSLSDHASYLGNKVTFLLDGPSDAVWALRDRLDLLGDSLVVSGRPPQWHVHIHVADAGAAIEAGLAAGKLSKITVTYLNATQPSIPAGRPAPANAVVAIAEGPGLAGLMARRSGRGRDSTGVDSTGVDSTGVDSTGSADLTRRCCPRKRQTGRAAARSRASRSSRQDGRCWRRQHPADRALALTGADGGRPASMRRPPPGCAGQRTAVCRTAGTSDCTRRASPYVGAVTGQGTPLAGKKRSLGVVDLLLQSDPEMGDPEMLTLVTAGPPALGWPRSWPVTGGRIAGSAVCYDGGGQFALLIGAGSDA
jgi:hypothetical protein